LEALQRNTAPQDLIGQAEKGIGGCANPARFREWQGFFAFKQKSSRYGLQPNGSFSLREGLVTFISALAKRRFD
jgi:hypothetical protein